MKTGILTSAFLLLCSVAQAEQVSLAGQTKDKLPLPPSNKTWTLIWHDEFDGTTLDASKWETPPDGQRKGGWWTRKAISLDGKGHLIIKTSKEDGKILNGCVRTKGKFEHSFGYYIARVRLPKEQGHWSSFWLFGPGVHTVGSQGREGMEIDIYEKFWPNDDVQHTLYWNANGKDEQSQLKTVTVPGIREGWHTFSLWWKPDQYVFYVDGNETWRINPGEICHVPQYIKLSDETADWCKDITKAKLPDEFLVDYVRVYDLTDAN